MDFDPEKIITAARLAAPEHQAFLTWTYSMDGKDIIIRLDREMPREQSRPIMRKIWAALKNQFPDVGYGSTKVYIRDPLRPLGRPDFICTREG